MIRIHSNAGGRIGEDDLISLESGRERTRGRFKFARIWEGEITQVIRANPGRRKMKKNFSLILCLMNLLFSAGVAHDLLTGDFWRRSSPVIGRKVHWRVKEFARSMQTEGGRKEPTKDLGGKLHGLCINKHRVLPFMLSRIGSKQLKSNVGDLLCRVRIKNLRSDCLITFVQQNTHKLFLSFIYGGYSVIWRVFSYMLGFQFVCIQLRKHIF